MNEKQRDFILLRAHGLSYDKIAQKLKTSKATLIQWSKLFEENIQEVQFHAYVEIKESYQWSIKSKYETLLKQLQKIDDGILNADLSQSSIKELFTIKSHLVAELEAIERKISIKSNVLTTDALGNKEDIPMRLSEV